ncbi:MAG TPA: hypothetical protein VL527_12720 [Dongiaceae bacterium]|jgi:hypothetical protein|nr:hypothetical protein [Dongiaceae bacterium]
MAFGAALREGTSKIRQPIFETRDCPAIAGFLLNKSMKPSVFNSKQKERIMNGRSRKLKTMFEKPTRFRALVKPAAAARGDIEVELNQLKERLLHQLTQETTPDSVHRALRQAADEAAALVWLTPYPLLFLPSLLEEKALAARQKAGRQEQIRERSTTLLSLAE